ncbi:TPA: hypothetical protein ACH3X2_010898 [Trebouxia sp. C0005]
MYGTPGRQLQHGISERQLHAASERIAEWLRHVTQLFPSTSPIASVMLARLCLPASSTCPDPPYSEDLLAKVVTVTKCLKNNKPPGVCNILPEMLEYVGHYVHSALYRVILGIWRTEQAPCKTSCYPFLRRRLFVQHLLPYRA